MDGTSAKAVGRLFQVFVIRPVKKFRLVMWNALSFLSLLNSCTNTLVTSGVGSVYT